MSIVTRFAPSPTGRLHLGHVHAAAFARRRARAAGGRFLLRIEDIDPARCRPAFAAAITADLTWLGLSWDGAVRVQSAHLPAYAAVLDRLAAEGLVYTCFCSRADIARALTAPHAPAEGLPPGPRAPDGAPLYPGTCRDLDRGRAAARLAAGQPHAWRLDMRAALARTGPLDYEEEGLGKVRCAPAHFGDVVLGRRDAPASYHLCCTHDDAVQGVTLVTRGEDLRAATDVQRVLQHLMGWPVPRYAHHRLLTDATGRRLAKRDGDLSVAALCAAGHRPAAVLAMAGAP
jgi:glutamyl-Q tRNA(Asp) synthetase